ncbi:MAG: hypothetical protein IH875_11460 [Candidatus Dadabacteria bacterium]|nr:hypothetical protein [Candidatus Dadabacteria bacterium]
MSSKFSILTLVIAGLIIIGALACNDSSYQPDAGDEVVIYRAKYKPADFEEAKKIHVEGFGEAMNASGQDRRTYFLEDEANSEIIAISFFKKGHTAEDWHDHEERDKMLKKLEPFLRKPITHEELIVIDDHSTE